MKSLTQLIIESMSTINGRKSAEDDIILANLNEKVTKKGKYGCQLSTFTPLQAGRALIEPIDIKAQEDLCFLYLPFSECAVSEDVDDLISDKDEIKISRTKAVMHDQIQGTISDIDNGETVAHDTCDTLCNDGVYVEIRYRETSWGWKWDVEDISMVYLVIKGKVVYGDKLYDYMESDDKYGPFTDEIV